MPELRGVWDLGFVLGVARTVLCRPTFAQVQTGEILGTVTDPTGAAVPGTTITVTDTGTEITRVIKTDDQGRYLAPDLNIGNYQVQATMQGFSTQAQKGFVLAVGQSDSRMIIDPAVGGKYNEGPCSFNLRKNWTSSFLIPLPMHGNRLKEGWEFAVISSIRSGEPVTPELPSTTDDISNLGYYDYVTERPNRNTSFSGTLIEGNVTHYFNPAAFVQQPLGYLGDAGRGMITAAGYFDEDFSVIKSTSIPKLGEGNRLETRGDFFNIFNHPNFGLPNIDIFTSPGQPNPQAGAITSIIGNQRQLQFSARFVF
jgi:hypothetical protein